MTQDTRKDRRVKIVSLNVRYKSATVDEFIENHSHDVSKGGIYIKTPNPFPPGTLLKFEIRLAGDQAVIAGVGRVVWKRDNTQANADRPAGMGVKFIKLDDSSKVVIDKLVLTKADAGKSFESEAQTDIEPAPVVMKPSAPTPIGGIAKPPTASPAAAAPVPAAGAAPAAAASGSMIRKQTMMGIGAVSSAPGPSASSPPPAVNPAPSPAPRPAPASAAANMFPSTNSQAEMPPKQEQTVMKQAAELLEEALKEAGGSMDEIGSNPLFAAGSGEIHPSTPPPANGDDGLNATVASTPVAKASGSQPPAARTSSPPVDALAREAQAAAAMAKSVPENAPLTARESPSAKSIPVAAEERKKSVPPAARTSSAVEDTPAKKKGGAGMFIGVFVVAAAAGVGVFMFRDTIFPPNAPPAPTAATSATVTTPPASASSTAAPSASVPPVDSAMATPDASVADAAPTKDAAPEAASTVAAATTTTAPPVPPPPTTKPQVTAPPPTTAPPPPTTAPPPPTTAAPPPTTPPTPKPPPPKPPPTTDNPY